MSEKNEHLTPIIAINIVIAFAGSSREFLDCFGLTATALHGWRKRGSVPAKYAKRMSEMTHGMVSPADLCPDVF